MEFLVDIELPECLQRWDDGSIRVAGHRITLYQIVDFLYDHHELEALARRFPSIPIEELRCVRAFCVEQEEELRRFHTAMRRETEMLRESIAHAGPSRDELLSRMEQARVQKLSK